MSATPPVNSSEPSPLIDPKVHKAMDDLIEKIEKAAALEEKYPEKAPYRHVSSPIPKAKISFLKRKDS